MSAHALTDVLTKLYKLHQSLYEVATRKTEVVKKSDIEALSSIMKEENKYVMAINQLDGERKQIVAKMMSGHPFQGNEPTLTECIETLPIEERDSLLTIKDKLLQKVNELKKLNLLNQELIYSSLQFVNLSLDVIMPKQPDSLNYNKPQVKGQTGSKNRSMFDSKA
ncbi:flagellar protein FlgN [Bacillus sp. BGMRC 2118]|nr:flagellar protein FlgN [Bacillus sp. BGMRC 2118]